MSSTAKASKANVNRTANRVRAYPSRGAPCPAARGARRVGRPRRGTGSAFSVPLRDIVAIEASTRKVSGTVRVTTLDGSLTIDQILGTQGEMLADDAREAIHGVSRPDRDPLELLAELRALRDSGVISAAEFEIRKSAIWRDI